MRIASVVWAFDAVTQRVQLGHQRYVLDIGSGLDAVSLALEAIGWLAPDHRITCVDPSDDMRRMAAFISSTVNRTHHAGTIEDLALSDDTVSRFDSIFFSYSLQYRHAESFEWAISLSERIVAWLQPGGMVLIIEPISKRRAVDRLKSALALHPDLRLLDLSASAGPDHLRRDVRMAEMDQLRISRMEAAKQAGLSRYARDQLYDRRDDSIYPIHTQRHADEVILAAIRT